jgi:hypothetical protein
VSSNLSDEAQAKSEALAPVLGSRAAAEDGKEDWCFGGLRRNIGATRFCPWGSTVIQGNDG